MSRILISGQWLWPQYQEACANALESLGHKVARFGWYRSFYKMGSNGQPEFNSVLARMQNRYVTGPLILRINGDLFKMVRETNPEIVWLYNDTHIWPETLLKIRRIVPQAQLVQYTNDNPWGTAEPRYRWRHFKNSIPNFDVNFGYRISNLRDFELAGSKKAALLRSYFIPEETYPIEKESVEEEFRSDVVFVGHFENDGRLTLLSEIAQSGVNLKLFGTGWQDPISRLPASNPLKRLLPVRPVRGEQYIKAICGSKIALSFLSKLNMDTYTRRSFELPAMKGFMLSEYTDDLNSLFLEGKEAEYFRTKDELMEKIKYYLGRQELIDEIARKGHERVIRDGHDVTSRMKQFMEVVNSLRD